MMSIATTAKRRVFTRGVGAVSPIGIGRENFWGDAGGQETSRRSEVPRHRLETVVQVLLRVKVRQRRTRILRDEVHFYWRVADHPTVSLMIPAVGFPAVVLLLR
jgi:hypothetical protein